jgi:hypothetical protein
MTVDIQQFSNKLAEIYSNLAKPVLDVMSVDTNSNMGSPTDIEVQPLQLSAFAERRRRGIGHTHNPGANECWSLESHHTSIRTIRRA